MAHLAEHGPLPDARDGLGVTRVHGSPFLFAIARDARTTFAVGTLIGGPSLKRDARGSTSPPSSDWRRWRHRKDSCRRTDDRDALPDDIRLHNSYRVEIVYFQPFDTWHSVAGSDEVEMPPQGSVELADVDLATIPFHLSFQQLANLFGAANDISVARSVSEFQKRVLSNDEPNEATRFDAQILHNLNLSLPELAAAERDFKDHTEKFARRARAMFHSRATSPARGFEARVAGVKPPVWPQRVS